MTTRSVTVTFSDGTKLFTDYSTVSDYANSNLYISKELSEQSNKSKALQVVHIDVEGYDSWNGIATGDTLVAPITMPGEYVFGESLEGVEEDGIIHLRALQGCGPAWCEYEFKDQAKTTKYLFSDGFQNTTGLEGREVLDSDLYSLARDGALCFECLIHEDVSRLINN